MCDTYLMAVIESLGQVITGLNYQNKTLSNEIEDLRKQLKEKEAQK